MADRATPNLPSSDFDRTEKFFEKLGFSPSYRDEGWLILRRGGVELEFFLWPEVDPATSNFSCCLRLDDLNGFYRLCELAGLPETHLGWPRIHPPRVEDWGGRVGALIDLDGTLLRLIENARSPQI
jgi:hypothetical protein